MMPIIKSSQVMDHASQPRALGSAGKRLKVDTATGAGAVQPFEQNAQPGENQKPDAVASRDGKGGMRTAKVSQRFANDALPVPSLVEDNDAPAMSVDSGAASPEAKGDLSRFILENPSADARRTGYEEGMEQGWNDGLEQGVQEGLRRGREEVAALQSCNERLTKLAEAVSSLSESWQAELESAAIEIGYAALLRILGQKSNDRAMVESMVRAVLEQLPERRLLNIHLAPADHALLHDGQGMPPSLGAALLADERVSMGGCIVDTDAGSLDGRLETRLAELKAVLVEVHHAREMSQ
jgi:flagellar assembly protein FliH